MSPKFHGQCYKKKKLKTLIKELQELSDIWEICLLTYLSSCLSTEELSTFSDQVQ